MKYSNPLSSANDWFQNPDTPTSHYSNSYYLRLDKTVANRYQTLYNSKLTLLQGSTIEDYKTEIIALSEVVKNISKISDMEKNSHYLRITRFALSDNPMDFLNVFIDFYQVRVFVSPSL